MAEQQGRVFNTTEAARIIVDNLRDSTYYIDLTSICHPCDITADDLQSEYKEVSWVNDFEIRYSDGTVINSEVLKPFWKGESFDISSVTLPDVFDKLSKSFDTTDGNLHFTTSNGKKIDIDYYTYGNRLAEEKELNFIKESIKGRASSNNRTPCLYGYDEFNDTYIEVSLTDQHVWHYVDGELCCETDCVTGTQDKHNTPTGVFYVSEKINGKFLRGEDYKTWVNKWMRLTNQGVGLHDAYWRGKFGGDIYQYNGSHGCINLPKKYAYALYDEISVGIPVVVYSE